MLVLSMCRKSNQGDLCVNKTDVEDTSAFYKIVRDKIIPDVVASYRCHFFDVYVFINLLYMLQTQYTYLKKH